MAARRIRDRVAFMRRLHRYEIGDARRGEVEVLSNSGRMCYLSIKKLGICPFFLRGGQFFGIE